MTERGPGNDFVGDFVHFIYFVLGCCIAGCEGFGIEESSGSGFNWIFALYCFEFDPVLVSAKLILYSCCWYDFVIDSRNCRFLMFSMSHLVEVVLGLYLFMLEPMCRVL